jgi:uncharacterized protein
MSYKYIPEHIDPFRFSEQALGLDGLVKIDEMTRLKTIIVSGDNETIAVRLQFGVDEQGINYLTGHLETTVTLQCQRCMEPYTYEIMSDFILGIVSTLDEANALPETYEPALAKEGKLALTELIEDEILLNLPIIPRHAPEECKVKLPLKDAGWEQEKGESPFHVLKALKRKKR